MGVETIHPRWLKNSDVNPRDIVCEDRLGLHHARHAGARVAQGRVLVFTDDDATFDTSLLQAYSDSFEAHPEMACCRWASSTSMGNSSVNVQ
jgi:glycosyltransferase involved in cell wall biosynthesis